MGIYAELPPWDVARVAGNVDYIIESCDYHNSLNSIRKGNLMDQMENGQRVFPLLYDTGKQITTLCKKND